MMTNILAQAFLITKYNIDSVLSSYHITIYLYVTIYITISIYRGSTCTNIELNLMLAMLAIA